MANEQNKKVTYTLDCLSNFLHIKTKNIDSYSNSVNYQSRHIKNIYI